MSETDDKDIEALWEWAMREDQYMFDEFGIGIVGIGALFFAYGIVTTASVKLIIAFIGLGGSLIIWEHMYGAQKQYKEIRAIISDKRPSLGKLIETADRWRDKGRVSRWLYQPASRLRTYFMALVSWAWATIILYRLAIFARRSFSNSLVVPPEYHDFFLVLFLVSIFLFGLVVMLTIYRKVIDRRKHDNNNGSKKASRQIQQT